MRKAIFTYALLFFACVASAQQRVSILGDSYSTFNGWMTPSANEPFYPHGDVTRVEQTWWYQVIANGNYTLEELNSYSGSTMTNNTLPDWHDATRQTLMDASTSFISRANNLGNPDVILVCGGTNDEWNNGNSMGNYQYADWTETDLKLFRPGTAYLMHLLKTRYPDAKIIFVLNDILTRVGESIKVICEHYSIPVAAPQDIEKDETCHPTATGMTTIATAVGEVLKKYVPKATSSKTMLNNKVMVGIAKYRGNRQCAVSLTFDDGIQEDYTLIAPHLDRYGLKGTFCINGAFIGNLDDHFAPRLTWEQCREMDSNGHEIASHSWSHINEWECPLDVARQEIAKNDSAITQELGKRPLTYFFPFNAYTPEVLAEAMKDRVACRLQQYALGQRDSHADWNQMNTWLQKQITERLWGVAMTHGIYTAWDQWEEPWVLWDFFRLLADNSDTVWTATFCDVASYIKERDNTKLDIKRTVNTVNITSSLDLDSRLFKVPLTLNIHTPVGLQIKTVTQDGKALDIKQMTDYQYVEFNPFGGAVNITFCN